MIKSIDTDEKAKNLILTLGGNQEMWFLTEDIDYIDLKGVVESHTLVKFEEGIDILNLKGDKNFEVVANDHGLINQNAINICSKKNTYLHSSKPCN